MALRGIMQSDPDQAFPMIEKMLSGTNSPKVKDRALFVLSQSHSAQAREIIAGVARGNANPDLQLQGDPLHRHDERRRTIGRFSPTSTKRSTDPAVKRAILRSFMTAGDKRAAVRRWPEVETDAGLRAEAVRQLGVMHASNELAQLYPDEPRSRQKQIILQSMFVGGDSDKLIELAKNETGSRAAQDRDPQPRHDEARRARAKR